MRQLHKLLLEKGLLVKRVRRRNKRKAASLEISTTSETTTDSTYLDLNVKLPNLPYDKPVTKERERLEGNGEYIPSSFIPISKDDMDDEEYELYEKRFYCERDSPEFDSDIWYQNERYGAGFLG